MPCLCMIGASRSWIECYIQRWRCHTLHFTRVMTKTVHRKNMKFSCPIRHALHIKPLMCLMIRLSQLDKADFKSFLFTGITVLFPMQCGSQLLTSNVSIPISMRYIRLLTCRSQVLLSQGGLLQYGPKKNRARWRGPPRKSSVILLTLIRFLI